MKQLSLNHELTNPNNNKLIVKLNSKIQKLAIGFERTNWALKTTNNELVHVRFTAYTWSRGGYLRLGLIQVRPPRSRCTPPLAVPMNIKLTNPDQSGLIPDLFKCETFKFGSSMLLNFELMKSIPSS